MDSTPRLPAAPSSNEHYDVIIIGTGAGGGTLAWRLAPSGKRILLIERGTYVPREKQNWDTRAVVVDGRYNCGETWRDKEGGAFEPGTHYAVGGNTKFYGAALIRMRESDFGEVRHMDGVSPAWPISYGDLEPYYTRAEYLYHVHGKRGADPTEPPSSAPYRHPAISSEPRIREIWEGMERQGHHPFPMPVGILLDETTANGGSPAAARTSACIRCNTCDGFPCLVGGKADAHVIAVNPALAHDNVTLLTGALARKLVTDAGGRRVTRVVVERDGAIYAGPSFLCWASRSDEEVETDAIEIELEGDAASIRFRVSYALKPGPPSIESFELRCSLGGERPRCTDPPAVGGYE